MVVYDNMTCDLFYGLTAHACDTASRFTILVIESYHNVRANHKNTKA